MDLYDDVYTMKIDALEYWRPWVPPRTGSKRYQRRRAQRWPKGK